MAEAVAAPVAAERVERSEQAMLVVDDDWVCTQASLGACRLLGAARSEVIGRSLASLVANPAGPANIAFTILPDVVPGSHLLRLDRARGAAGQPSRSPSETRRPTARECEILGLLAGGATDARIAALLDLSPATVQTHVRNAKAKLGASTRTQAVALAIRRNLITTG